MDRVHHSVLPATTQGDHAKPRRGLSRWLPHRIPIVFKLALSIATLISFGMMLLGSLIIYNQAQLLQNQINDFGVELMALHALAVSEGVLSQEDEKKAA